MASTTITTSFSPSYYRKVNSLENVDKNVRRISRKFASDIVKYAKGIAPYETGLLTSLITFDKSKGSGKGYSYTVVSLNPVEKGGGRYRREGKTPSSYSSYNTNGVFDLVKWAHKSGYAPTHFKSGEARYMFKTKSHAMKMRNQMIKSGRFKKGIVK